MRVRSLANKEWGDMSAMWGSQIMRALREQHDPEKWPPVFGKDHAAETIMIPKSGHRFSAKIMLAENRA